MKKLITIYDKLYDLYAQLEELACELILKQVAIEEKAADHDRDLTEREQERYDELEEIIGAINECNDNIESAFNSIEGYCE